MARFGGLADRHARPSHHRGACTARCVSGAGHGHLRVAQRTRLAALRARPAAFRARVIARWEWRAGHAGLARGPIRAARQWQRPARRWIWVACRTWASLRASQNGWRTACVGRRARRFDLAPDPNCAAHRV